MPSSIDASEQNRQDSRRDVKRWIRDGLEEAGTGCQVERHPDCITPAIPMKMPVVTVHDLTDV